MTRFVWGTLLKTISRILHSPFGFQIFALGFFVFFLTSFRPPYFLWSREPFGDEFFGEKSMEFPISEVGFLDNFAGVRTAGLREILVEDEDGKPVVKIQPRKRDRTINYTVKSGDNPSKIAHKFGLKVSTLLWSNDLNAKQSLQVGQKLRIPPADGVYYTAQSNDTLTDIAQTHNIELTKIYAYNQITEKSTLQVGQEVFLPDAKKIFIEQKIPDVEDTLLAGDEDIQSIGIRIRRPTQGTLTQGFHKGHYAIDIANKLNTPIYSAAEGVVTKAEDSGWNYGYGRYLVIDHGNGVETLYAHFNALKVGLGDQVKTGQLIGLMGNSGRVWGPTGIHLHLELHIRGRKVNPYNYF